MVSLIRALRLAGDDLELLDELLRDLSHWSNLRVVSPEVNLSKGSKFDQSYLDKQVRLLIDFITQLSPEKASRLINQNREEDDPEDGSNWVYCQTCGKARSFISEAIDPDELKEIETDDYVFECRFCKK